MLMLLCIAGTVCENYSHIGESVRLLILDHNTENKIKYYVAYVFIS